jgi:hypothetical protein
MFTLKKRLPIIEEVPLLLGSLEVGENLGPTPMFSFSGKFSSNFNLKNMIFDLHKEFFMEKMT